MLMMAKNNDGRVIEKKLLLPFTASSSSESDTDDVTVSDDEPRVIMAASRSSSMMIINNDKKRMLLKQLSMKETSREAKWEHRCRQIFNRRQQRMMAATSAEDEEHETSTTVMMIAAAEDEEEERRGRGRSVIDEDLDELRGSIELGFGFNEEDGGQNLCDTLPALDLYFAVNRQLSDPKLWSSPSPASTPTTETPSPRSPQEDQQQHNGNAAPDWKICNLGDNPQAVKMRLRHWAQAVACSVRQCC